MLVLGMILATTGVSQQKPAGSGLEQTRLQTIRPRLQALVDNQTIPGAVALVARHGKVSFFGAVGWRDVENKKPMQTSSIFQITSMTKNFTGVAVMMLVEEGRVELRRPIEYYLPEFHGIQVEEKQPDGSVAVRAPQHPPTVWQLMSHTSGLGGDPDGELADNPRTLRFPLADAVQFYARHLRFEPGARWSYRNMGIAALGRLVEVISGKGYVEFMRTRILDPLGMKDTFFFLPADQQDKDDKKDRRALVYKHADGKLVRAGDDILAGDAAKYRRGAKYPAPEFGLYSTAGDLFRFYQMLLNGGEYNVQRYLSRQAIDTMTRVFTPDVKPSGWLGGTGYGLTFEIVNQPEGTLLMPSPGTFGHSGAFGTEGWIDPKNDLIRIMLIQVSDKLGRRAALCGDADRGGGCRAVKHSRSPTLSTLWEGERAKKKRRRLFAGDTFKTRPSSSLCDVANQTRKPKNAGRIGTIRLGNRQRIAAQGWHPGLTRTVRKFLDTTLTHSLSRC
jgi:CubicO group peptidase (beta-lactamase class C family)